MKRFYLILSIILAFVMGCQDVTRVETPEKLLTKSEMKSLIYDMVLLDAAAGVNEKRLKELDINMLEFLNRKYGLDSNQLKQNILYYNLSFDENSSIYEQVKDSIAVLERAYDSISRVTDSLQEAKQKKQDSIKGIETNPKTLKIRKAEN